MDNKAKFIFLPLYHFTTLSLFLLLINGCSTPQTTGYIGRNDHPYDRKINGDYEKVTGDCVYVLKKRGWAISEESLPSIYERDERYDGSGYQNLLIITDNRKKSLTTMHLNIFIHSIGNDSDIEVRYEGKTSMLKDFISTSNNRLVNGLLDAVEQQVKE